MLPYVLLIMIPLLMQYVAINKKGKLYIGKSEYVRENNLALTCFFSILLLILMLRHENVGKDLMNYKSIYYTCSKVSVSAILEFGDEILYYLLNWLIGKLTDSYQVFIGIMAILTIVPIGYVYCKRKKYGYLKIIIFVNLSTFVMLFSGIRQSLAMAVGMIAYEFVKKKRWVMFGLICVIAINIHISAFMLLLMYPLYYMNLKNRSLWIVLAGIMVFLVFNKRLFFVFGKFLESFTDYRVEQSVTGAYATLLMYILFLLFSYVMTDDKKMTQEAIGHRNFLFLCVLIQCFAPLNPLAMRMGYYYMLFIPLSIVDTLEYSKTVYRQITKTAEIIMSVFFTLIFVWSTYQSFVTGESSLQHIPYQFFWKG